MTWSAAVPAALVATAWCVLPGALMARALGWRGIVCWGSAPLFSIALIATAAVLAGQLGVYWGPWPVVATSLLAAAVALAARAFVRSRSAASPDSADAPQVGNEPRSWRAILRPSGPDGVFAGPALLAGMGVTVAISSLTIVLGLGAVDTISPTYDAVHHYSAVARILGTGDGSSLTLGGLTNPGRPTTYPAAWHDVVALVVLTSAASIPVASNLVALTVAAIIWPLSCVLLVRQMVGRRAGAFLVTPILATAFTAMPWTMMTFGVLWPNLLGLALVPAALAAVVTILGLTHEGAFGRSGALLLGAVAVPALGFAHPNSVLSLLVLALSPVVYGAVIWAARWIRERRRLWAAAAPAGAIAAVLAVVWFLARSPLFSSLRAHDWPASMGTGEAISGMLWNATNGSPELVVVSVLVLVGAMFAVRNARTGWLVPAHLTSGFLYVLAVSQEGTLTTALTGPWYNDYYRLAAMIPITGVPLAAIGVVGMVGLLVRAGTRLGGIELAPERHRLVLAPAVAIAAAGLVLASDGFRIGVHAFVVAANQREAASMLQPGQREFLFEAGRHVPPDAVVAANPWTGNALLYPLTGREVMFPHLTGNWTPDQQVIQERLRDVGSDPTVCEAVRATDLTHVIDGPVSFWPGDERSRAFPGLAELDQAPGFEPVTSGGGSTLYRITACAPDPAGAPG